MLARRATVTSNPVEPSLGKVRSMTRLLAVHPIVEVGDMSLSIEWYCEAMGFEITFDDGDDPPGYVGLQRDGVEIHLQSHREPGWAEGGRCVYRFMVDDPDSLLAEFRARSSVFADRDVADTAWGTREFSRYDPDGNSLFFYRDR
jgi:catechol 2,3-dioxygenase-like lactoylglutathione lyase family enzyme